MTNRLQLILGGFFFWFYVQAIKEEFWAMNSLMKSLSHRILMPEKSLEIILLIYRFIKLGEVCGLSRILH